MTIELYVLLLTAIWTISLLIPVFLARLMTPNGIRWAMGNRDAEARLPSWHARASKAHANMVENLAPFAVIIVVAHFCEVTNTWTIRAAIAFLICRIFHAVCYWFGLTPWRTHFFILSLIAEALIVYQIWLMS